MKNMHASDKAVMPDLALILDSLPHGVVVVGKDAEVFYANMIAEQMFHASSTYLMRKGLKALFGDTSSVFDLINQVIKTKMPVNEYRVSISKTWYRETYVADIYATPMAEQENMVILMFRERGVEDRIDRQLDHRAAARSVTGLASMLGHEIKNPLAGIRGAAQLLGDAVSGDDGNLVELITSETDRIVRLVDRMEFFSNETPIKPEPVNMHSVLGDVKRIAETGFELKTSVSESYDPSLPNVSGSRDELMQVFINLVKNAAESIRDNPEGKVSLSSAYRSGIKFSSQRNKPQSLTLEFTVRDNGGGISEELKPHIFDPFVTSKINGSGLGLAMVAKTIERHGGVIECESDHSGTEFKILLPAWENNNG